ncbi:hypothetical protein [Amycolatopsis magusensis]|uniref:Ig-like domain-containing protein n=1 Tax=Amycolatopsis magusensis TaxID=882444 RepID=A0ABS4PKM1_9PSEU|nr:hypothetical protein [Amycolatopsis magusensis]MBP2179393.1 hypothetical protein [Amycolatopsis magusensis]
MVSFGVGSLIDRFRRRLAPPNDEAADIDGTTAGTVVQGAGVSSYNSKVHTSMTFGGSAGNISFGPSPKVVLSLVLGVAIVLAAVLVIVVSTHSVVVRSATPAPAETPVAGPSEAESGTSPPSASPSPAGTKSTSCQKEGSEATVGDLPFTCTVEMLDSTCGLGGDWVTDKDVTKIAEPMPSDAASYGWRKWPAVSDGVQASGGRQTLIVQGKGAARVVLTKATVKVVAKRQPVTGKTLERECGGDGVFRSMSVELDKNPPEVSSKFESGNVMADTPDYEVKPIKFPYTVALEDPESFIIEGITEKCDCDWVVELAWSSQGRTGTTRIDNNGVPFRTTSTANAPTCYVREVIEC